MRSDSLSLFDFPEMIKTIFIQISFPADEITHLDEMDSCTFSTSQMIVIDAPRLRDSNNILKRIAVKIDDNHLMKLTFIYL